MAAADNLDPWTDGFIVNGLAGEEHCYAEILAMEKEAICDPAPRWSFVEPERNGAPVARDEIDRCGHSLMWRTVGVHPNGATVLDG